MQQIRTTHIIIIVLLIGVVTISILMALKKASPTIPTNTPANTPVNIPSNIKNQAPTLTYQVDPSISITDQKMNLFTIVESSETDVLELLSQAFNLNNPKKITLNTFEKFVWLSDERELSYYPITQHFLYTDSQILDAEAVSFDQAEAFSHSFIRDKFSPDVNIGLLLVKRQLLNSNGNVSQITPNITQANLTEIEARYLLDNLPLILPPYESPDFQIKLNQQGMRQVKMKLIPKFLNSGTGTVINFEEAKQKLITNQGTILKVNNLQHVDGGPLINISQMKITKTSLGYVAVNKLLIPSYIFTGTAANTTDSTTTYSVEVAVPALQ